MRGVNQPEQKSALRARPADWSLVAEDRSAGGVRDWTGPDPRSVLGPWRTGTTGARTVTNGHQRPSDHRLMDFQLRHQALAQRPNQIVVPRVGVGAVGQQTGSNRCP